MFIVISVYLSCFCWIMTSMFRTRRNTETVKITDIVTVSIVLVIKPVNLRPKYRHTRYFSYFIVKRNSEKQN